MIAGHSERRIGFGAAGESSELVAEKTKVEWAMEHCNSTSLYLAFSLRALANVPWTSYGTP